MSWLISQKSAQEANVQDQARDRRNQEEHDIETTETSTNSVEEGGDDGEGLVRDINGDHDDDVVATSACDHRQLFETKTLIDKNDNNLIDNDDEHEGDRRADINDSYSSSTKDNTISSEKSDEKVVVSNINSDDDNSNHEQLMQQQQNQFLQARILSSKEPNSSKIIDHPLKLSEIAQHHLQSEIITEKKNVIDKQTATNSSIGQMTNDDKPVALEMGINNEKGANMIGERLTLIEHLLPEQQEKAGGDAKATLSTSYDNIASTCNNDAKGLISNCNNDNNTTPTSLTHSSSWCAYPAQLKSILGSTTDIATTMTFDENKRKNNNQHHQQQQQHHHNTPNNDSNNKQLVHRDPNLAMILGNESNANSNSIKNNDSILTTSDIVPGGHPLSYHNNNDHQQQTEQPINHSVDNNNNNNNSNSNLIYQHFAYLNAINNTNSNINDDNNNNDINSLSDSLALLNNHHEKQQTHLLTLWSPDTIDVRNSAFGPQMMVNKLDSHEQFAPMNNHRLNSNPSSTPITQVGFGQNVSPPNDWSHNQQQNLGHYHNQHLVSQTLFDKERQMSLLLDGMIASSRNQNVSSSLPVHRAISSEKDPTLMINSMLSQQHQHQQLYNNEILARTHQLMIDNGLSLSQEQSDLVNQMKSNPINNSNNNLGFKNNQLINYGPSFASCLTKDENQDFASAPRSSLFANITPRPQSSVLNNNMINNRTFNQAQNQQLLRNHHDLNNNAMKESPTFNNSMTNRHYNHQNPKQNVDINTFQHHPLSLLSHQNYGQPAKRRNKLPVFANNHNNRQSASNSKHLISQQLNQQNSVANQNQIAKQRAQQTPDNASNHLSTKGSPVIPNDANSSPSTSPSVASASTTAVGKQLPKGQVELDMHGGEVVNSDGSERFSRKVFVGGLPPDIDEEEIKASFRRFGLLQVDWPHKAESKSYFPPKGYAFLLFHSESAVRALIDACIQDDNKLYLCVSSPTIQDKPVQIRPWRLCDADHVLDSTLALDPRKTVFVGGVPRPLKASDLAIIMNQLYGGVCYAGIDTDPEMKYPKGAGRVAFSNHDSYIAAISARFVHLHHSEIDKRVEVKPYVLDDQYCDECSVPTIATTSNDTSHSASGAIFGNVGRDENVKNSDSPSSSTNQPISQQKFAPFFCANITCLRYYCENCWSVVHSCQGREYHKPLVKEGSDKPRSRWNNN